MKKQNTIIKQIFRDKNNASINPTDKTNKKNIKINFWYLFINEKILLWLKKSITNYIQFLKVMNGLKSQFMTRNEREIINKGNNIIPGRKSKITILYDQDLNQLCLNNVSF